MSFDVSNGIADLADARELLTMIEPFSFRLDSAQMRPPCNRTMLREIVRPRPEPRTGDGSSSRTKRSNILFTFLSGNAGAVIINCRSAKKPLKNRWSGQDLSSDGRCFDRICCDVE